MNTKSVSHIQRFPIQHGYSQEPKPLNQLLNSTLPSNVGQNCQTLCPPLYFRPYLLKRKRVWFTRLCHIWTRARQVYLYIRNKYLWSLLSMWLPTKVPSEVYSLPLSLGISPAIEKHIMNGSAGDKQSCLLFMAY